jgi:hypothetical protein
MDRWRVDHDVHRYGAPYASGTVGLYNEDSHVQFDDVRATVPASP